jgi:hypothetical protein
VSTRRIESSFPARNRPHSRWLRRLRLRGILIVFIVGTLCVAGRVAAQTPDNPEIRRAIAAYEAGELTRALDILLAAPVTLSGRDAAIRSLYMGLVYFALGEVDRSRDSFTRAVMLDAAVRLDPSVHSPSRIDAFHAARNLVVSGWRAEALAAEERGDTALALQRWQAVLTALPDDETARARVASIEEARRRAQAMAQAPPARDSIVRDVEPATPDSAIAAVRLRSPGQAFALGLLIPGLGEIYAGRGFLGVLALAAAGGAVAAGYLAESVSVKCATEPVNNFCPPEDVIDETKERPYLGAGVAAAAGITLLGAVDALLAAHRSNARARAQTGQSSSGLTIEPIPLAVRAGSGQVRLELLRVRF